MAGAGEDRHEIIIVRRGHDDDEDGHHGGVWKIAFADFMTAMMCFFLVMWLINAANEQTKAAVASYFNPVRLIDRNSSRKGLADLGDGPSAVGLSAKEEKPSGEKSAGQDGTGNPGTAEGEAGLAASAQGAPADKSDNPDQHLFTDPYAVLSEIAGDTGVMQNLSAKGAGGAQDAGPATGAEGGQSYRDPFSPDFWSQQETTPEAEASAARARVEGEPAKPGDRIAETDAAESKAAAEPRPDPRNMAKDAPPEKAEAGEPAPSQAEKAPDAAALRTAAEVERQIAAAFKLDDKMLQGISVQATDKGVSISITDRLDFGMFEIGSAMPRRELVLAMEKIGRIVNAQKGAISIAGHTDARPFHSASYDNWRLSTARAHAAYYMLVRGGLDEARVKEVSGFADRQPKDKADPYAAVNRRIEILLETGG